MNHWHFQICVFHFFFKMKFCPKWYEFEKKNNLVEMAFSNRNLFWQNKFGSCTMFYGKSYSQDFKKVANDLGSPSLWMFSKSSCKIEEFSVKNVKQKSLQLSFLFFFFFFVGWRRRTVKMLFPENQNTIYFGQKFGKVWIKKKVLQNYFWVKGHFLSKRKVGLVIIFPARDTWKTPFFFLLDSYHRV